MYIYIFMYIHIYICICTYIYVTTGEEQQAFCQSSLQRHAPPALYRYEYKYVHAYIYIYIHIFTYITWQGSSKFAGSLFCRGRRRKHFGVTLHERFFGFA